MGSIFVPKGFKTNSTHRNGLLVSTFSVKPATNPIDGLIKAQVIEEEPGETVEEERN